MPTYKYEASYASGERVNGVVEAVSQTDAVAQIRQTCEVVLSLKEVPKVAAVKDPLARFQKISAKSLALVCKQFSIILKAGMPLVQTVDLVAEQCPDKNLSALLRQVSEDVSNGWSLSYSFEQRGEKKLPVTFRETVRAGEESGDLLASFERLADYFERMNKTKESVTSALTYPAFVMVVAVVVVWIIMNVAVPRFIETFNDLGTELPLPTVALIAVSNFFQHYTPLLLLGIAAVVMGLTAFRMTPKGGVLFARVQLKIPVVGEIVRMSGASQFAHTMSTLLAAGMPILQAIEVSGRTMTNLCMAQDIADTLPGVESGHSLGECMGYAKELPAMLVQMTAVGEATGDMESTLQVLAQYYDNEVDVRTKQALALLEPTIIVFLAVFVVWILLALYLPMFSMYSSM